MSLATRRTGVTTALAGIPLAPTAPTTTAPAEDSRMLRRLAKSSDPDAPAILQAIQDLQRQTTATPLAPSPAPTPMAAAVPAASTAASLPPPPPPPAPMLPPISMTSPIPGGSGAGAMTGVPPWLTLLQQMPSFGGAMGGMGGAGMPVNMQQLTSLASSLQGGGIGQGFGAAAGTGAGPQLGAGGRMGAGQVPALGQGGGMGGLMQQIQGLLGSNASRFSNAFGMAPSAFPFASFLQGGGGFGSFFNPMMGVGARGMGGFGGMQQGGMGGLGMTGMDPRANDMRRLLLSSLFGGGGGLGGGGGNLDVG